MKKKVLTTAAALAMLAPTMTSFASTTVTGTQHDTPSSELKITGTVNDSSGQAPEGQISVSLPTSVSFVVHDDSTLQTSGAMVITNNSSNVDIDVSVSTFVDKTPTEGAGITIIDDTTFGSALDTYDRSFVSLTLVPTSGTSGQQVKLLSENFSEQPLVTLDSGASTGLTLTGQAGQGNSDATHKNSTNVDDNGTNDEFTLTFKIAKHK